MLKICKKICLVVGVLSFMCFNVVNAADLDPRLVDLSKKSVAKAKATAGEKITEEMIKEKVQEGLDLITKEGPACFDKFRGDTPFIFSGTYLWVQDDKGITFVHPMMPQMEGKNVMHLKDAKGKMFFAEMTEAALNNPEGAWVSYWWPKPGAKKASKKVSFLKKTTHNGKIYIIGCGVYDDVLSKAKK